MPELTCVVLWRSMGNWWETGLHGLRSKTMNQSPVHDEIRSMVHSMPIPRYNIYGFLNNIFKNLNVS